MEDLASQLDLSRGNSAGEGPPSRRPACVQLTPSGPDLSIGSVYTIARLTDVIGWSVPAGLGPSLSITRIQMD